MSMTIDEQIETKYKKYDYMRGFIPSTEKMCEICGCQVWHKINCIKYIERIAGDWSNAWKEVEE